MLWGSPTKFQGGVISKTGATSTLNIASLSNIDRSSLYMQTGATMTLPALTTYAPASGNELRADGPGSKLDFSSLTKVDLGAENNYVTLEAYNGGIIDAHNLSTIAGTSGVGTPIRVQSFGAGSIINLNSLTPAPDTLSLDIRDGATLLLGAATSLQGATISKTGAASVFNTTGLTNIDRSSVYAQDGAVIAFPNVHTFASASYSELRADGVGSKLDLTGLNTIDWGSPNNYVYFEAYNGGAINAQNLATITGTTVVAQPLRIQAFGADSFVNIKSLAIPANTLSLDLRDGGSAIWSKPPSLTGATINMSNGASLDTSALTSFTNGSFTLTNASTNLPLVASPCAAHE